jgi:transcriptional regulator with XRE-family HTH domain
MASVMGRIKHKNNNIRETLGISQEEMALLLKIHPSQIAMYETGKRELPVPEHIKLMQMYAYVEKMLQKMPEHYGREGENARIAMLIEKELEKNYHDQIKCRKKLDAMKEKCRKAAANFHLADYLEGLPAGERPSESDINFYRLLGKNKIEKYGPAAQTPLELQLETLKWQHKHLTEELKKYLVIRIRI